MTVRVLLFAQMRVDAGRSSVDLELPEGAKLGDALESLFSQIPVLRAHAPSCRTAVGVEYVSDDHALRDGDEISLIPPVQGG
jgi:molybdopterin converting factor small subunit